MTDLLVMELKFRAAVLGATGVVGQRLVSLLAEHPWFDLVLVAGSEQSAGRKYVETVKWVIESPIPKKLEEYVLESPAVDVVIRKSVDVAFVALPAEVAEPVEVELAKQGIAVVSNASPMRREPDVPLLNPEVNADHLDIVKYQKKNRGWEGFIVKVPNCTTAILTLSLKPLLDEFGIRRVIVSSMQAISGAGLTGLPSLYILDNIIPYIENEEEKVENESLKILGEVGREGIKPNSKISVSASCHRVMVLDGHTLAVFVELERTPSSIEEIAKAMEVFKTNKIRDIKLPSAPDRPIVLRREADRPQPRLDRFEGRGMSVVVGRVRRDAVLGGVKYVVLGHNTLRGAAGTCVLVGELLAARGLL